ncbi:photosystem II D1 precursor processing protein PSB27-H2, chloroplastic isoform X1 [Macadamia integrifolia]|uniref:photosystem II D1 precursor processing protein PSB27-H2, chloroplastic isoform X1 n=1 Tax=Macadamia integrifolia TaxID=60698 RepID=UPI001C4E5C40|nr:photosystem II D1 precursor processing protein PSB27-H2, chloroplastic isoform X1 [Macadamia integrifolia]
MTVFAVKNLFPLFSSSIEKTPKPLPRYKLQAGNHLVPSSQETLFSRRHFLICNGASLVAILTLNDGLIPPVARAEEKDLKDQEDERKNSIIGAVQSLFDPNEKTKSGKVLPKAYLKSAREVVKTLRESLKEDAKDITKFRRTADAAKESIREYLSNWKGQQEVVAEESYVVLEKAIRSLASFYSKAGPSASLPEEVKSSILDDLDKAEAFW